MPTSRLKWWVNWLWSEKPAQAATSARDRSVPARRSALARSTRRVMTNWCGGRLELPREVVDAEAGRRGQLLQGQAGVEVFLDVLDDGPEPPPRQRAVPP